jgi:hypothetical protein
LILNRYKISGMFQRALRLSAWPAFISLLVTFARFFAERAELPEAVCFVIGIAWLTLAVGAYFGFHLADERRPYGLIFLSLLAFAILSRIPVSLLWWVTKTYGMGTHYDVFSGWGQVLYAQFIFGVPQQVITGGIVAVITVFLKRRLEPEST